MKNFASFIYMQLLNHHQKMNINYLEIFSCLKKKDICKRFLVVWLFVVIYTAFGYQLRDVHNAISKCLTVHIVDIKIVKCKRVN